MISVCPILHQSGTLADWRSRLDAMLESAHAPAFVPVAIRCHLFPSSSAVVRLARPSIRSRLHPLSSVWPGQAELGLGDPDAVPPNRLRAGFAWQTPVSNRRGARGRARARRSRRRRPPTGFEPVLPARRRFPTGGALALQVTRPADWQGEDAALGLGGGDATAARASLPHTAADRALRVPALCLPCYNQGLILSRVPAARRVPTPSKEIPPHGRARLRRA